MWSDDPGKIVKQVNQLAETHLSDKMYFFHLLVRKSWPGQQLRWNKVMCGLEKSSLCSCYCSQQEMVSVFTTKQYRDRQLSKKKQVKDRKDLESKKNKITDPKRRYPHPTILLVLFKTYISFAKKYNVFFYWIKNL